AKEQLRCRHCCHELEREANRASRSKHLFGSLVIPCSAPIARTPPRARMAARSDRSAATKWRTNQPDRRACKAAYSCSLMLRWHGEGRKPGKQGGVIGAGLQPGQRFGSCAERLAGRQV